ncbi:IKI3 family-domain-containing protein [Powellomyces hirtus]|nr:IKI3 family-domain-containing protein [Powellomyces hirtus]
MRSLQLLNESRTALFPAGLVESSGRSLATVDPETATVYCSVGSREQSTVYSVNSDNIATEVACFPDGINETAAPYQVVGLQYLPESQALCVALTGGDIILIQTEDGGAGPRGSQEVVGTVDSGILCIEWSPDHELVIIVTGTGTLLEMTKDFDVITEVPIHVSSTGEAAQVNVGWGRKETQFHGSEGKQAALAAPAAATVGKMLAYSDDLRPRISWRGDGSLFACSAVDPNGEKRVVRMYDRECVLQYTSEPVPLLEHALAWRPSGNLIASSQRLPHRHDIVFFEKNGLRHGEFTLRDKNAVVVEALWNIDSSVLAIWLMYPEAETVSSVVQLWTVMNYHWYLKQEIRPTTAGDPISGVNWDPENALRLHIMTRGGSYQRTDFCSDHFISTVLAPDNPATVAVVDGASVLLTPFRHLNVPPPMSAHKVTLPAPAAHVAFGPGTAGDDFAVLLCDASVHFYKSGSATKPVKAPKPLGSFSLADDPQVTYRQLVYVNATTVAALAYNENTNEDAVATITFDAESYKITGTHTVRFDEYSHVRSLSRLQYNVPLSTLFAQAVDGRIAEIPLANDAAPSSTTLNLHAGLPTMCPWISAIDLPTTPASTTRERVYLGLSGRNKLYANSTLISSDCTSFHVHNDFLILTTFTHTARFISLNVPLSEFKLVDTSASPFDEHVRRVERGSKIVIAVPSDTSLVLQMPRGNLETVYPRALVLAAVRRAISNVDYRTAFVLCRKHRIDLNFLVDCDRQGFEKNVENFVSMVDDPDYLNLFISSLRDEDVTITMYTGMGKPAAVTAAAMAANPQQPISAWELKKLGKVEGKTNAICDIFRTALQTVSETRYTHSILTTDVKKSPPDLETAMRRILTLKTTESSEVADSALKYVIFLADVDKLYDVALGMYDFPLTLMVAQHSQKDPREYLPFLSELQKLEQNYQRFRIDDHLGKRDKALGHLSVAGEQYYNDCLTYTAKHNIYKAAMNVFKSEPAKYRDVLALYADDLEQRSEHADAAMLYHMAGKMSQAMQQYRQAAMWQQCFAIAAELDIPTSQARSMAMELADELARRLQFRDAARVLVDHANDPARAIDVCISGALWDEAARIAHLPQHNCKSLVDTAIRPRVTDAGDKTLEDIAEMSSEFDKRTDRLRRFREEKARLANLVANNEEGHDPALDNIDMFSDTTSMATTRITGQTGLSSVGTRSTTRTARTARAKRKQERKRATGRDKAYEDEYLIGMLRKLVHRTNSMRADVLALIRALMLYTQEDKARAVQVAFKQLITKIEERLPEIFSQPIAALETAEEFKQRIMDSGGDPALAQAPVTNSEPPPVLSDEPYGITILE